MSIHGRAITTIIIATRDKGTLVWGCRAGRAMCKQQGGRREVKMDTKQPGSKTGNDVEGGKEIRACDRGGVVSGIRIELN